MHSIDLKTRVINLRKEGKTYSEIRSTFELSKSTISNWCATVEMPESYRVKLKKLSTQSLKKAQSSAKAFHDHNHAKLMQSIDSRNRSIVRKINEKSSAKLALAMLYLAEGSKTNRLMFGNSDPMIVKLFLKLLRKCFRLDERKFRCTVQCRADQNIGELENFWSGVTGIPQHQFYAARVDPRSIGQVSRKKNYKGVCRIDYFSVAVHKELSRIAELINLGYINRA